MATADRIAYVNHDIDDAIRAGILREGDLPASTHAVLGPDHSSRIQTLVVDMVETSAATDDIRMSEPVWAAMMELRAFLFDRVYMAPVVMEEVGKATRLIEVLFGYYIAHTGEVPQEYRAISGGDDARAVTDYIAGMTDRFAKSQFQKLFIAALAAVLGLCRRVLGPRGRRGRAGCLRAMPACGACTCQSCLLWQ